MSNLVISKSGKIQLGLAVIALSLLPIINGLLASHGIFINNPVGQIIVSLPWTGIYVWLLIAKTPLGKLGKIGLIILLISHILSLLGSIIMREYSLFGPISSISFLALELLLFLPGTILFYLGSRLSAATKILAITTPGFLIIWVWGGCQHFVSSLVYSIDGFNAFDSWEISNLVTIALRILLLIPLVIVTIKWMTCDNQSSEHGCDAT